MSEQKQVEICTNDEWYRVLGPLDASPEDDTQEASGLYQRTVIDRLEMDDRVNFRIVSAIGQRSSCHGWNGAQWKNRATGEGYCIGGIGTFYGLTEDEIAAIDEAHFAGVEAANNLIEEIARDEEE